MTILELRRDPSALRDAYQTASPFPHAVIDELFPDENLDEVLNEFPGPNSMDWVAFDNPREKKLGFHYRSQASISHTIRDFLWWMNSPPMLEFLQTLTGIDGLIPDPYFGGGGLHQIVRGGFLDIHADFNWHPLLRLDRRLNVLIYLNKDWKDDYGGHLELWDRELTGPLRRILPVFNRTVVFSTTDFSYHGHPRPLTCPEHMTRKSVSLYYYTNGRPNAEQSAPHDTIFR